MDFYLPGTGTEAISDVIYSLLEELHDIMLVEKNSAKHWEQIRHDWRRNLTLFCENMFEDMKDEDFDWEKSLESWTLNLHRFLRTAPDNHKDSAHRALPHLSEAQEETMLDVIMVLEELFSIMATWLIVLKSYEADSWLGGGKAVLMFFEEVMSAKGKDQNSTKLQNSRTRRLAVRNRRAN